MGLANPHRQGSGGVHEDDDAHGSSGPQRVRSKRRVGRKCRGMCWKPPPLPQSLLQRDAADRKENRKRKIKENMEEKKRKKKLKLREMEEAKRRASREEDDEEDELNGAEEDEETPAAGAGSGSGDVPPPSEVMFSEDEAALKTMSVYLEAMGHKVPTPIQERCWPACLGQCDVQARAKPGTGKTFGYMFPLLYALATGKQAQGQGDASSSSSSSPRALVLVPTRELAKQVLAVCRELKRLTKQRGFAVTGGVLKEKQLAMLQSRHDVTIATPGRLCDLIDHDQVDLSRIGLVVIDEADKMFQMGFADQLQKIQDELKGGCTGGHGPEGKGEGVPPQPQPQEHEQEDNGGSMRRARRSGLKTFLFSATFTEDISSKCEFWLREGSVVRIDLDKDRRLGKDGSSWVATSAKSKASLAEPLGEAGGLPSSMSLSSSIRQVVHVCAEHKKGKKVLKYIHQVQSAAREEGERHAPKVLVFVNTIRKAKFVHLFLKKQSVKVGILHGKRTQGERDAAVSEFKGGKVPVLVATDVAARGIHINKLRHVVLYDFPPSMDQYVHRVGRTGRQDEAGEAIVFFTRNFSQLAPSLVHILEMHKQDVDPNLKLLANAAAVAKKKADEKEAFLKRNKLRESKGTDA